MKQTGVIDIDDWRSLCYSAARNSEVFKDFRSRPLYLGVVEGVTAELGGKYLEMILNDYDFKIRDEMWSALLRNDSLGTPPRYVYDFGNGSICSSALTLRYIKVFCDLVSLFDFDKIQTVAEIGIGFGGQCRIMLNFLPNLRYNLIDLPEVILLAERFLTELDQTGDIRYIDGTHLYNDVPCDLVVSNYAFAELTKETQEFYIEKVISKSKAGYMTWNRSALLRNAGWNDGYEVEEILAMIPGSRAIPENPPVFHDDCIIIWGTRK